MQHVGDLAAKGLKWMPRYLSVVVAVGVLMLMLFSLVSWATHDSARAVTMVEASGNVDPCVDVPPTSATVSASFHGQAPQQNPRVCTPTPTNTATPTQTPTPTPVA